MKQKTLNKQRDGNDLLAVVSGSYSIDFGGHCKAKLLIKNGKIKIEAAMNGRGEVINLSDIIIEKL